MRIKSLLTILGCTTFIAGVAAFCGKKGKAPFGGDCIQNAIQLPARENLLAISFDNETNNCAYANEQITFQFLATQDGTAKIMTITNISTDADGYTIGTVGPMNIKPGCIKDCPMVPAYNLGQLKGNSFYLKTDQTIANARFFISLKGPLESLIVRSETFYEQPKELTPWDIFEFGYDPNGTKAFGFNTTQVASFSIPLWFSLEPINNIPSNPKTLPVGIKLRDTSAPVYLTSQQDIINKYTSYLNSWGTPELFELEHLKQVDSNGDVRIIAPTDLPIPNANKHYFDDSFQRFFDYFKGEQNEWPFHMCTNDPGPNSTEGYPNLPLKGYRDIGNCFYGYYDAAAKTFKFWRYDYNKLDEKDGCNGKVTYNANGTPNLSPPTKLCEINSNIETWGLVKSELDPNGDPLPCSTIAEGCLTRCALENNCFTQIARKTGDANIGIFNTYLMAAIMRNDATNKDNEG